jgi:hypothetical protein
LVGKDGNNISLRDDGLFPVEGPGRYLFIKDDLAYELEFVSVNDMETIPGDYDDWGNMLCPPSTHIARFYYQLVKMANRYGDAIEFTYGGNKFDFSAVLSIDGAPTGERIDVTLTDAANQGNIPNLTSFHGNALDYVPADQNIKLKTSSSSGEVVSYTIQGAITPDLVIGLGLGPDTWIYQTKRWHVQPVLIQEDTTGFSASLTYQWVSGYLPYAQGIAVGAVVISKIAFSNHEEYLFDYEAFRYHATQVSMPDWEPMAWGLKTLKHMDTLTGIVRTTTYDRKVPLAQNWLESGWDRPRVWLTK